MDSAAPNPSRSRFAAVRSTGSYQARSVLGFVNLFKPAGPTSTQFGARLRGIYGSREHKLAVGHLGTLDPQASGVLPIALGSATRLLPLIEDRRKSYAFTLVFGAARPSTG